MISTDNQASNLTLQIEITINGAAITTISTDVSWLDDNAEADYCVPEKGYTNGF